jgi:NitT/TauT family transport system permease protein
VRGRVGGGALRAAPLAALIVLWQLSVVDPFYVSRPSLILARLYDDVRTGALYHDAIVTIVEVALGYGLGAALGLVLGYGLALTPRALAVFEPYLITFQSIPKTAIAPLFIMWLGIGIWSKVVVAASMVFFLVFYNTLLGMRMLNEEWLNLARIMGASERDVTRRVVLPSVLPYALTGLRTALPYAIIGVIVGEFIAARAGLGVYILRATSQFDPAGTFVGILVLIALVWAGNGALGWTESRLTQWRPRRERTLTAG